MPKGLGHIQKTILQLISNYPNGLSLNRFTALVKSELHPNLWNYNHYLNYGTPNLFRFRFKHPTQWHIEENQKKSLEFNKCRVSIHNAMKSLIKRGYLIRNKEIRGWEKIYITELGINKIKKAPFNKDAYLPGTSV